MSDSRKMAHARRMLAHGEKAAAVITDTQRIDYLERHGYPGQFTKVPDGRWFDNETDWSNYSPTLRVAIDAAITLLEDLAASKRKPPHKVTL